ncbi:retrovirus-related pol polyprotein from transposon TNT 1-94 [Tanacetum coccineum]
MNMILLSIPNEIYNSVDSCTSAKDMWKRVERLMRGNKVYRETRFTNEFDQFVAKPGEALVFVYNRFAQLMNDLERNSINFLTVTINTKFLNSLQPEKKLVNASREKKLEKYHDPLALVANMGSSSRQTSSNYVTHPIRAYVQEEVVEGMNAPNETGNVQRTLRTSSSGNTSTVQCYNCSGKGHYARNYPKPRVRDSKYFMEQILLAKHDEAGVILTDDA